MNYLPLIVFAAIIVLFLTYAGRQRRRQQAAALEAAAAITVGTEVMTTSGLHGVVVSRDSDAQTAVLAIAPGVEVRWELAALRDLASVPGRAEPGVRLDKPADRPNDEPR